MAQFNEGNSVRDFIRDLVESVDVQSLAGNELPRRTDEVMLEGLVKAALVRLNPEIAADPDKADEVIYNLRAIMIAARTSPHPVVANEHSAIMKVRVPLKSSGAPAAAPPCLGAPPPRESIRLPRDRETPPGASSRLIGKPGAGLRRHGRGARHLPRTRGARMR